MKVALISRSSAFKVKGGDTIQLQKTAEGLKNLGVDVSIFLANDKIPYQHFDLLHFFNIIRPADHLSHIRRSGKPFVLSTIYLDYSRFDRYGRNPLYGSLFSLAGRNGAEYIKNLYRYARGQDRLVSPDYLLGHRRSMLKVLRQAALLLPNSLSEYQRLQRDLGIEKEFHVVPNGIDRNIFGEIPANIQRKEKVISVAQVYGMKNQHMLIEACNALDLPLEIIGKPPPNHHGYYDHCRRIAGPRVTFIDHMPQHQLVEHYAAARVHALPSWFETTGLTSLEAGAMGCNLVVGRGGDVHEYLGEQAWYCDPRQPGSLRLALEKAMQAGEKRSLRTHILDNFSWEDAAQETLKAYKKALNEK